MKKGLSAAVLCVLLVLLIAPTAVAAPPACCGGGYPCSNHACQWVSKPELHLCRPKAVHSLQVTIADVPGAASG